MRFKKATSFILSLIMALSSLNVCLAETQADNSSEPETVDAVASEAAADYGISLASSYNFVSYAVKGGNIHLDLYTGRIVSADIKITEADIPSTIEGYTITTIGATAFRSCRQLTKVKLPDTITTIEDDNYGV